MDIIRHDQVTAKVGEPVSLVYNVTDDAGVAVNVDGCTAVYKLARRSGDAALLTLSEAGGITLAGTSATVTYTTDQVLVNAAQGFGDFWDQISITKNGDKLYVSEGIMTIETVIT